MLVYGYGQATAEEADALLESAGFAAGNQACPDEGSSPGNRRNHGRHRPFCLPFL